MKQLATRKKLRLPDYDYASAGAYFVTICTADRQPVLWQADCSRPCSPADIRLSDIGRLVEQCIAQITGRYPHIRVDKYCIMPDHVHLLLMFQPAEDGRQVAAPTQSGERAALSTVVGHLKRWVSMQLGYSVWQKSFFEHVVRNEAIYQQVWKYIDENPLQPAGQ